jgi:hypothetical protein
MSDTKSEVSEETLKRVGGGECSVQDYIVLTTQLTDAYESLIDFTSYVIGRINGDPPPAP